jgi:hypothetical protein
MTVVFTQALSMTPTGIVISNLVRQSILLHTSART